MVQQFLQKSRSCRSEGSVFTPDNKHGLLRSITQGNEGQITVIIFIDQTVINDRLTPSCTDENSCVIKERISSCNIQLSLISDPKRHIQVQPLDGTDQGTSKEIFDRE